MLLIPLLATLLLLTPAFAQTRAEPQDAPGVAAKPLVTAKEHMIVAAHPLAAQAGGRMMASGGSAADAALLVLNVVEPQSSGIGGGAFALVHGPDGLTTWDARATAPAGVAPDLFMENGEPLSFRVAVASGRSIGVPGLVRLMEALHASHGKRPWADLFQPAIRVAHDGFEVSPRLANMLARYARRLNGTDAADGGNAFYTGPLAERIIAAARRIPRPGALNLHDLAAYRVIERPAVCHRYRRYRICGMGPSSSGATTTAAPPAIAAAASEAIRIIQHEPARRERLWTNRNALYAALKDMGWPLTDTQSPILPIIVKSPETAVKMSEALFAAGVYVPAIRPPTVPKHSSRLRLTVSSEHTKDQLENVVNAFRKAQEAFSMKSTSASG